MASVCLDSIGRSAQYFAESLIIVIPCEQAPVLGRKRRFGLFFAKPRAAHVVGALRACRQLFKTEFWCQNLHRWVNSEHTRRESIHDYPIETAVVDVGQK